MTAQNNSDEIDWVEKLYKPKFDLDRFVQNALGNDRWLKLSDKEVQADVPRPDDYVVSRSTQTDGQLWSEQDLPLLRRAYANQVAALREKYTSGEVVEQLRTELEEMRENWRSTQQDLEDCRAELSNEKAESERLRIAIVGLKRFCALQLAEADDARWVAQLERKAASDCFSQRLEQLKHQQAQLAADRAKQQQQIERERKQLPSTLDLASLYRHTEEIKCENRRLLSELADAQAALSEYERSYKMLLKHVKVEPPTSTD